MECVNADGEGKSENQPQKLIEESNNGVECEDNSGKDLKSDNDRSVDKISVKSEENTNTKIEEINGSCPCPTELELDVGEIPVTKTAVEESNGVCEVITDKVDSLKAEGDIKMAEEPAENVQSEENDQADNVIEKENANVDNNGLKPGVEETAENEPGCQDEEMEQGEVTTKEAVIVTEDKVSSRKAKRNKLRKVRSIVCYSTSSSTDEEDANSQNEQAQTDAAKTTVLAKRRLQPTSSEESESDNSMLSLSSFDSTSDSDGGEEEKLKVVKKSSTQNCKKSGKVKNDIMEDLPPIEDLHISVKKEECTPVGVVYSIVNSILVVESLLGTPPLNLDSVLFQEDGEAIGRIFDVFGPVSRPFYALRISAEEDATVKRLGHGTTVYCAPQTEHTAYVFTYQLMKEKGSDASWKHDEEPPPECLDYSDDEQEMIAKRNLRQAKLNKSVPSEPGAPSTKRFSVNRVYENPSEDRHHFKQNHNVDWQTGVGGRIAWEGDDVGWHNRRPQAVQVPRGQGGWPRQQQQQQQHHYQQQQQVLRPQYAPPRPPVQYCVTYPPPVPSPPPHRFGCPPTFQQQGPPPHVFAPHSFRAPITPPTFYQPRM